VSAKGHASTNGDCIQCEESLRCTAGGRDPPKQKANFYAHAQSADGMYQVYRCHSYEVCPEDMPIGSCLWSRRHGVRQLQAWPLREGRRNMHHMCRDSWMVLGALHPDRHDVCALLFLLLHNARPDAGKTDCSAVGCCTGISITSTQALGALSELQIERIEPMVSLGKLLDVFTLTSTSCSQAASSD